MAEQPLRILADILRRFAVRAFENAGLPGKFDRLALELGISKLQDLQK